MGGCILDGRFCEHHTVTLKQAVRPNMRHEILLASWVTMIADDLKRGNTGDRGNSGNCLSRGESF